MPDGSIIVGGTGYAGVGDGWDFMLVRCDSIGVLDGSFGTYGYVCTNFNNDNSYCVSMAVQCDGKIVAVGTSTLSPSNYGLVFTILRYNANGSLDNSFGRNGVVHTNFGNTIESNATCVGLHNDGRITVAGYLEQGGFSYGVAQYLSDGSPDSSFGTGGVIEVNFPYGGGLLLSMIIQPDQKILIGGGTFSLARFNIDGTTDNTFGKNGSVENYFGSAAGLTMQADGKILQTGSSSQLPYNTVLARYTSGLSNGPVDNCQYPSFPFSEPPSGLMGLYPNPSNGYVDLLFALTEKENADIELYDIWGVLVMTSTMEVNAGLSYYNRLDFSLLRQGDYIMKVQLGSQTYIKKLVKTE